MLREIKIYTFSMSTNPEYLQLSVSERIQLVEDIWDSISADATDTADALALTKSQRDELDRRLAHHIANPNDAIPWEVVRAKLFSKRA